MTPERIEQIAGYLKEANAKAMHYWTYDDENDAIGQLLEEVGRLQKDNTRLVEETYRWSAAVKKLEAERGATTSTVTLPFVAGQAQQVWVNNPTTGGGQWVTLVHNPQACTHAIRHVHTLACVSCGAGWGEPPHEAS